MKSKSVRIHKALPKSEYPIEDIDDIIDPMNENWKTLDAKSVDPEDELKRIFWIWLGTEEGWKAISELLNTRYDVDNLSKFSKVGRFLNKYFRASKPKDFVGGFNKIWPTFEKQLYQTYKKYVVDQRRFGEFPEIQKYIKRLLNYLNS